MWILSKVNYGEPKCSDVEKNPVVIDKTKAQAWKHKGNWLYNYKWALTETKFRRERLPTKYELLEIINSTSGNCTEKANILDIPFAWYHEAIGGDFGGNGSVAYLWTSSLDDENMAQYVYISPWISRVDSLSYDRGLAISVRSVK